MNGLGYLSGVRCPGVASVIGWAAGRSAWGPRTGTYHLLVTRDGDLAARAACGGARTMPDTSRTPLGRQCRRCLELVPDWETSL